MTVSFRTGRYLVALLWHTAPWGFLGFTLGCVFGTWQAVQLLEPVDDYFYQAMTKVVHQCAPNDPANTADAEQVNRLPSPPPSLFARFSATVVARQVHPVVGPEGNFLKAVGDRPQAARASPWPLLGTNVPCDGASSCASSESPSVGVARSARGNPYQASHEGAKAKVPLTM